MLLCKWCRGSGTYVTESPDYPYRDTRVDCERCSSTGYEPKDAPMNDLFEAARAHLKNVPVRTHYEGCEHSHTHCLISKLLDALQLLHSTHTSILSYWGIESDDDLTECVARNIDGWKQRALKAEALLESLTQNPNPRKD